MLHIFDPFLRNARGHFLNLDTALADFARQAGHDHIIYRYAYATETDALTALNTEPFFVFTPAGVEFNAWQYERRGFFAQLRGIDKSRIQPGDTLFFHSLNIACLCGAVDWLESFDDLSGRKVCFFFSFDDFVDGETFQLNGVSNVYREFYSRLGALSCEVEAFAESQRFTGWMQAMAGEAPVTVTHAPYLKPMNLLFSAANARAPAAPDGGATIGWLGVAKASKGALLLPKAIQRARTAAPDLRFIVQSTGAPDEAAWADFRALAEMDGVEMVEGALSPEDYYALLARCDFILLPYGDIYRTHSSAIFYEALAIGVPAIVPRHSTMEGELHVLAAPTELIHAHEAEAVADAILRAYARREEICAATARIGPKFFADRQVDRALFPAH